MANSKTRHCFSFALKLSCSSAGFRRWPWGSKTSILRESKPSELKESLKFLKQSEKVLEVTAFSADESASYCLKVTSLYQSSVYCFIVCVSHYHCLWHCISLSNLFWYFKNADLLPLHLAVQQENRKGYPRISQSCTEATWNVNLSFTPPPPYPVVGSDIFMKITWFEFRCGYRGAEAFTEACSGLTKRHINRLLSTLQRVCQKDRHTFSHSLKAVYGCLGFWSLIEGCAHSPGDK